MWFLGFPTLRVSEVFGFGPNFLAVLDGFFFGFAVSNIIYPNAPLRK